MINDDSNKQLNRDLVTAEQLLAAERDRIAGTEGYTVDEFKQNMMNAIARGAGRKS